MSVFLHKAPRTTVSHVFHALKQQESEDLFCITLGGGTIGLMSVEVREETAA